MAFKIKTKSDDGFGDSYEESSSKSAYEGDSFMADMKREEQELKNDRM